VLPEESETEADVDPMDPDPSVGEGEGSSGGETMPAGEDESSGGDEPDGSTGADPDPSGTTGDAEALAPSLVQAAFNPSTGRFEFGFDSIPEIPITGAPADVDWDRWGMLHDGTTYRLYFLPQGEADELLQFGFNPSTVAYEWGHDSIPAIPITGTPAGVDPSGFAMLHDGSTYRLYFLSENDPLQLVQFGFDPSVGEYVYGHQSIPEIPITGTPAGTDWSGWEMLHDGSTYRLYAFADAGHDALVQHGFNPATTAYEWGHDSIPQIDLSSAPAGTNTDDFAMLHDGTRYRFYMLTAR
jgi:hypothetical protein